MTTKDPMTIRQLTDADYERAIEIWTQVGLSYRPLGRDTRDHFQRELEQPTSLFLGAEDDGGELVGVVLATHDGRKGWINRLAVVPEHQGKGIGKALTLEAEHRLNELGILIITCLIEGGNDMSKRFFQSLGYVGHPSITYYSKRQSPDW
jgi:ribosomal protein S18 acetylase RimI-like enzyme